MKKLNNFKPNNNWLYTLLPIVLLIGLILLIFNKFKGLFNSDMGARSQETTNAGEAGVLNDLKKTVKTVTTNHKVIADKIFTLLNVQMVNGLGGAFSAAFKNPSQKIIDTHTAQQVAVLLFSPNCNTYGDIQAVMIAYDLRRHDNRENLYLGFLWDDHRRSLINAFVDFLPDTHKFLNNVLQDATKKSGTTPIYWNNYKYYKK